MLQTVLDISVYAEPAELSHHSGFSQVFVVLNRASAVQAITDKAHEAKAKVCVATDLLALTQLTPPGEWGADIVIGSAQRFGVPMGYGGPHAAFLACHEEYKRLMPGRIIGGRIIPAVFSPVQRSYILVHVTTWPAFPSLPAPLTQCRLHTPCIGEAPSGRSGFLGYGPAICWGCTQRLSSTQRDNLLLAV